MASPWLTSSTVVSAIKRKITLPTSEELLSDNEILAFVNEEMFVSMVPSILSYHEEFFVTRLLEGGTDKIELEANKSRYTIPTRAIGSRLRDLFLEDDQGNLKRMERINPDNKTIFDDDSSGSTSYINKYYLESTDIILVPDVGSSPTENLVFSYYLRPNQLVEETRAATISNFSKTITVDNSTLAANDTITINGTVLTAVTGSPSTNQFQIGASSSDTATNLKNLINTLDLATASVVNAVITCLFDNSDISISTSDSTAFVVQNTTTINCSATLPTVFTASSKYDLLQTKPGHQTKALSIEPTSLGTSSITFDEDLIPDSLVAGDYICLENECIIPQIPTDLHIDLVERACARILAAIGDQVGLQIVNAKIQENSSKQGILIDNRVDGSPEKIFNRNSILRQMKGGFYRKKF